MDEDEASLAAVEQDWDLLIQEYQPPHEDGDWYGPRIWPLLQAAQEQPILRSFYASTAVNCLVIYWNDQAWRADEGERWPAISIHPSGEYVIKSDPWSVNATELLVTEDPLEAVKFLASVIKKEKIPRSGGLPSLCTGCGLKPCGATVSAIDTVMFSGASTRPCHVCEVAVQQASEACRGAGGIVRLSG